jgi:hypothetical protein
LSDAIAARVIDLDVGLEAGAMVIPIPIQMLPIETVERVVVAGVDRAMADVFAEHGAVLGYYQAVIAALSGAVFCLFGGQFFSQLGDPFVDELRAVVHVKTHDAKGEQEHHGLHHFVLKPDFFAGLNQPANRFQAQFLCFVHADVHIPA